MGWVTMSQQELRKVEIIAQVEDGRMSKVLAAETLLISERTVYRLAALYREGGAAALAHRSRGKPSNRKISRAKQDYIIELVRQKYPDFGPTLAAEYLESRDEIKIGRETLRKWMIEAGVWVDRKTRKAVHQLRKRRDCYGELVQLDGSDHDWFEGRALECSLLVFVDDATNSVMELRFAVSENTFSYMQAMEVYLERHGRPVALYSDKHSVFRINQKQSKSSNGMTQFGRAMAELNIDLICADTSQAKGLVERKNRTLQDRLIKWMRLEGITGIDAANRAMPKFIREHNDRFARMPREPKNLHRKLQIEAHRLAQVLSVRDEAYVGQDLACNYDRKRYIIENTPDNMSLIGRNVTIHKFADGRVELSDRGRLLHYSIYDKRPRIDPAAIVENKRLGSVLGWIKAQQEKDEVAIKDGSDGVRKVKNNNSRRNGNYKPTGKRSGSRARRKDGTLLPPTSAGAGTKERTQQLKVDFKDTEVFEDRLELVKKIISRDMTVTAAAKELGVSVGYMSVLTKSFRENGSDALRPKRPGRPKIGAKTTRLSAIQSEAPVPVFRVLKEKEVEAVLGGVAKDTLHDED